MMDADLAAITQIKARLAQSRAELSRVLDPPPPEPGQEGIAAALEGFPRSRTMRALLSGRGLGAMGAVAAGLIMARPSLALKLLRLVPVNAVGKMLLARFIGAMAGKHHEG